MIEYLIKLANYLDESGFEKEADEVDLLIKNAFAPLGAAAIEKLLATAPAWAPPAKSVGISLWVWAAGVLGLGAGLGTAYVHTKQQEEEARLRVLREYSKSKAGGVDPDLDEDELIELQEQLNDNLGELIQFPDINYRRDFDTDTDTDFEEEYDEDDDSLCHLICLATGTLGESGFTYYFYPYDQSILKYIRTQAGALALTDASSNKEFFENPGMIPLNIYEGYKEFEKLVLSLAPIKAASGIYPQDFRSSFYKSSMFAKVCTYCTSTFGERFRIAYMSDVRPLPLTEIRRGQAITRLVYVQSSAFKDIDSNPITGFCPDLNKNVVRIFR
tara:strand:- start:14627 stop:15616 length:990 start_codon:yes stop_codon:yes gene_type:complete